MFDKLMTLQNIARLILCGMLIGCALGCQPDSQTSSHHVEPVVGDPKLEQNNFRSNPIETQSGLEILDKLVAKYRSLQSYRDSAVLTLKYRLKDQAMREPQPWSVQWDQLGRLSARFFNAKIVADGELLSCFVYDIESGNLDNQHLLIPYQNELPLQQLYRDSIAKYFSAGYSELPLDESDLSSAPPLIPPTLALLSDQLNCPWIHSPEKTQRLKDEVIDDRDCFVVRSLAEDKTADIWIEKQSLKLVKISLPLKILAKEVIVAPEISDVELIATFENAQFNPVVNHEDFGIEVRPDSTPVKRFVAVPEIFPSELIGQSSPEFKLIVPNGRARTRLYFEGKITAFLWMGGVRNLKHVEELGKIWNRLDPEQFHVAAIFSDSELKNLGENQFEPINLIAETANPFSLPVYYDRHLEASKRLKLNTNPALVVFDQDSKIQFCRSLGDDAWKQDLIAVLNRVNQGDDVASEMRTEYLGFIDSYHQQLAALSAHNIQSELRTNREPTTDQSGNEFKLNPVKVWDIAGLQRPGNMKTSIDQKNSIEHKALGFWIFDGWRTISKLGIGGSVDLQSELDLAANDAVSVLRFADDDPSRTRCVFSILGKQAYLFDENWVSRGKFPRSVSDRTIRDGQLTDADKDGRLDLILSLTAPEEVCVFDIESGESQSIFQGQVKSIGVQGNDILMCHAGRIIKLSSGKQLESKPTELRFQRMVVHQSGKVCAIGADRAGHWSAVGFDAELNREWTIAIGPQYFENEIEPLVCCQSNQGELIWAIADSQNVVQLVSGKGQWLGDFQADETLTGIGLASTPDSVELAIANETSVQCWNLIRKSAMIPASFQKVDPQTATQTK
ncbi:MAG: hypothetical protein AAF939_09675 [Planctomycetota bacterium]